MKVQYLITYKVPRINRPNTKIVKRLMYNVVHSDAGKRTSLFSRRPLLSQQNRYLPYNAYQVNKQNAADFQKQYNLDEHHVTHALLVDKETGVAQALLTSANGTSLITKFKNLVIVKISEIKFNGTFVPKINPKTKEPYNDSFGNFIPSEKSGGQFLAMLKQPLKIHPDVLRNMEYKAAFQAQIDKKEALLKEFISKFGVTNKLPRQIGGQDDE